MRNITKILLLIVIAFVAYLLWPRTGNLKNFDPTAIAKLEVQNWQAQKAGKGFDSVIARYKIYTSQYHFSPIAAYRIAQSQNAALDHLKRARQGGADPAEENRALSALTEKYTIIKDQSKGDFNPDSQAREEFGWRTLELDGAPPAETVAPFARLLAGLYGGNAEDFTQVATDLITARALIFTEGAAADDPNPTATAQNAVRDAYALLKEIAATPLAPAPPSQ